MSASCPAPSNSTWASWSRARPTGLSAPWGGSIGCGAVIASASGPAAANACGLSLRRTPAPRQKVSAVMPMSGQGVARGSKGCSSSDDMLGMTSVPSGPIASCKAETSPAGPPSTGPVRENDVWTSSTPPRRTPRS